MKIFSKFEWLINPVPLPDRLKLFMYQNQEAKQNDKNQ